MLQRRPDLARVAVSATTRPRREGEQDGREYYFLSDAEFQRRVDNDEFEEHVSTLRIESGEAYWQLFSSSYGPTKVLADSIGDRREELHRAWVESLA